MTRNNDRKSTYGTDGKESTERESIGLGQDLGVILLGNADDEPAGAIFHDKDNPRSAWVQSDTLVEVEE